MKKVTTIILCIIMVFAMMPLSVFAESRSGIETTGFLGDKKHIQYTYNYSTNTLTLHDAPNVTEDDNAFNLSNAVYNSDLKNEFMRMQTLVYAKDFSRVKSMDQICVFLNLKKIIVEDDNPVYSSDKDGVLYNKDKSVIYRYPGNKEGSFYEIPASVKAVGDENSYRSPFGENSHLEKIRLGKDVETISKSAFKNTQTGEVLQQISAIEVVEGNNNFISKNGVLFTHDGKKLIAYPEAKKEESYIVPTGTETIGNSAFSATRYLKHIELNDELLTIEPWGLAGMEAFEGNLDIPASVQTISECGMVGNYNLTSVNFSTNSRIKDIPRSTFSGCRRLRELNMQGNNALKNLWISQEFWHYDTNLAVLNLDTNAELVSLNGTTNNEIESEMELEVTGSSLNLQKLYPSLIPSNIIAYDGAEYDGKGTFSNISAATPITYTYKCGGKIGGKDILLKVKINVRQNIEITKENFPDPSFRAYVKNYDKDNDNIISLEESTDYPSLDLGDIVQSLKGIELLSGIKSVFLRDTSAMDVIDVSGMASLQNLELENKGHYKALNLGEKGTLHIENADLESESTVYVSGDSFNFNDIAPGIIIGNISNVSGANLATDGTVTGFKIGQPITYTYYCGQAAYFGPDEQSLARANRTSAPVYLQVKLNVVAADRQTIPINAANFPDAAFRNYVKIFDENNDEQLSAHEQLTAKVINFSVDDVAHDMEGIKYFTELTDLTCLPYNQKNMGIKRLELNKNSKLKYLDCSRTLIELMNVSVLPELETLFCNDTKLKTLDVLKNTNLRVLDFSSTNVKKIDVSTLKDLEYIFCYNNAISELDLSKNLLLEEVNCSNTLIKTLNLDNNPAVQALKLINTSILGVDLSKCKAEDGEIFIDNNLAWLNAGDSNKMNIYVNEQGDGDDGTFEEPTDGIIETFVDVAKTDSAATVANAKFKAASNTMELNLEQYFPGINPQKITVISGAELEGAMFTGIEEGVPVVYEYDCGKTKYGDCKLKVTLNVKEEATAPPYVPPYVPPTDSVENNPANNTTTADVTTSVKDNTASAVIDKQMGDKIIDKAVDNKSTEIIINATTSKDTTAAEVKLPADIVYGIADKTDADVTIKSDVAEVTMDAEAVEAAAKQIAETKTEAVTLVVENTKNEAEEMHFELSLITESGKVIPFNGGNVSVTVKLNKTLQTAEKLVCVYIDDNGVMSKVKGYKNADGTFTFITGHFSTYAIMAEDEADKLIEEQTNARLKAGVENTTIKLKSALDGKGIKLSWTKSKGYKVDYYEVYKSTKKANGYGTTPYYKTKDASKTWYKNTKELKKGVRYYYKVRGVREIGGKTVYTKYSTKAWRLVK